MDFVLFDQKQPKYHKKIGLFHQPYITIILVVMISLLSGIFIAKQQYMLVGLLFGLMIALLSVLNIKIVIYLFYISVFIPVTYIERYFIELPAFSRWLPQLFLALALALSILQKKNKITSNYPLIPKPMIWIGVSYLILVLFSMLVNSSSFLSAIWSLRGIILIYGSVIIHRLNFTKYGQEKFIRNLIIFGLLGVPVTLIQRLVIIPSLPFSKSIYDMVTGPFGSYDDLVLFQIFCIIAVTSWWIHGKKLLPISPILLIGALFFPLVISYSKAAPLYFFVTMVFVFWLCRKRVSHKTFFAIIVIVILGIVGTLFFDLLFQATGGPYSIVEDLYTIEGALAYLLADNVTTEGGLQRGAALLYNFDLIQQKPHGLLLGLGPGSFSSSRIAGATGYIYAMYPNLYLNFSSLTTMLGELGFLGVLITIILLMSFYFLKLPKEGNHLIVLRKGTIFLLTSLLFYGPFLLFPLTALLLGLLSVTGDLEQYPVSA
jgi:hypothetical protein